MEGNQRLPRTELEPGVSQQVLLDPERLLLVWRGILLPPQLRKNMFCLKKVAFSPGFGKPKEKHRLPLIFTTCPKVIFPTGVRITGRSQGLGAVQVRNAAAECGGRQNASGAGSGRREGTPMMKKLGPPARCPFSPFLFLGGGFPY